MLKVQEYARFITRYNLELAAQGALPEQEEEDDDSDEGSSSSDGWEGGGNRGGGHPAPQEAPHLQKVLGLPNPKYTRRKVKKLCNREDDGTLLRHTYQIPERFRDKVGIPLDDIPFVFQDPICLCAEKLMDPTISTASNTVWEAEEFTGTYGEMNTGNWMRDAERRSRVIEMDANLLGLGLYTDGSNVDFRGGVTLYPIVFTSTNFIGEVMRSERGKFTVGYWPKVQYGDGGANSEVVGELNRDLQQWCVARLMESIEKYRDGVLLELPWPAEEGGGLKVLNPVMAVVITDWPEGQLMSCMKAGATCSHKNCRVCDMKVKSYGETDKGACGHRRYDDDSRAFAAQFERSVAGDLKDGGCLEAMKKAQTNRGAFAIPSGFWAGETYTNSFGVHSMVPMDTLHTLASGIVPHLKQLMVAHSKLGTKGAVDARLQALPRVLDADRRGLYYRRFTSISHQQTWTASDYVALLQQLTFVVGADHAVIPNVVARQAFITACKDTTTILVALKQRVISEEQLYYMHAAAKRLGPLLTAALTGLSDTAAGKVMTVARPKVHALLHLRYFIRRYGAACNFDSSTFETNHQDVAHGLYARDCNRAFGRIERLTRSLVCSQVVRMLRDRRAMSQRGAVPAVVPELRFTSRLPLNVGEALTAVAQAEGGAALLAALRFKLAAALPGCAEDERTALPVYGALRVKYASETVVFACTPRYRAGGPRHDAVAVNWAGEPASSVARLVCLFGPCKSRPLEEEGGGGMLALVRLLVPVRTKVVAVDWVKPKSSTNKKRRTLEAEATPLQIAFPHQLWGEAVLGGTGPTSTSDRYEFIDVSSINAHAHLMPRFVAGGAAVIAPGSWWLDHIPLRAE